MWKINNVESCQNLTGIQLHQCIEEKSYTTNDIFPLSINNSNEVYTTEYLNQTIKANSFYFSFNNGLPKYFHLDSGIISQNSELSLNLHIRQNLTSFIKIMDPKLQFQSLNPETIPQAKLTLKQNTGHVICYLKVKLKTCTMSSYTPLCADIIFQGN